MKTNTLKRWIIVIAIWGGVVFLSFWNSGMIDDTVDAKQMKISVEQERLYVETHTDQINAALQQYRSIRQTVEALNLGLFELEKQLKHNATRFDLQQFRFDKQMAENGQVLISVFLTGSIDNALNWIALTEKECPHIQIRKVSLSLDQKREQALFSFDLLYRYRLASTPITGSANES